MRIHKMNDRKLQNEFNHLNTRFFHDKIVLNRIGYISKSKMPNGADGYYHKDDKSIFLDSRLKDFPNFSCMVLIHELAHAYLEIQDYKGYPADGGHGMMFQAELVRLIREGCYDGIL